MSQDRATFQQLAETRLAEARVLLDNGHPSGAYYLAGYAVECALKAKIATQFRANEIPDKGIVSRAYDHDFNRLLDVAKLTDEESVTLKTDEELRRRWTIVAKWKADSRYQVWSSDEATDLVEAVDGHRGLMQWLLKL